jgi:predicted ATPase/GAF domain-containing protein
MRRKSVLGSDAEVVATVARYSEVVVRGDSHLLASITASHALESDGLFQLQRVTSADGIHYLVKFAVAELKGAEDALLRREFAVFDQLRSDLVASPLEIAVHGSKLAAIYQDFAGAPLTRAALEEWVASTSLLDFIIALCAPLDVFHSQGLIVAGLSPESYLCDPSRRAVILGAAPLARRHAASADDHAYWPLTTHLRYAAPEIIGRAPLPVDSRADLYALGAVLYTLLCGDPPFDTRDPSELIQCHLAKTPRPLSERAPDIDPAVAGLVMRLLSKDPDQRFASVSELVDTATRELSQLSKSTAARIGVAPESFAPHRLSSKLYGIDQALHSLTDKIGSPRTSPTLTLVRGEAGVGKTSLLMHMRSVLTRGHFCRGRFDHSAAVTPLSGWGSALTDLANVLLTLSAAELSAWQTKIAASLGENAALLCSLAPQWSVILPSEATKRSDDFVDGAQNRIAVAIHGLLRCFAQPDAPLVLVLDDLQWADQSSLAILELVLTLHEPINLIVLGAVRSAADGDFRELDAFIGACQAAEVELEDIQLTGWARDVLQEFVSDSLRPALLEEQEFCDLLLTRTHGNPLFAHALLKTLIARAVLVFDVAQNIWNWQVDAVCALPPADSVVEFLVGKLHGLEPELQDALRTSACLGTSFSLSDFLAATGQPRERVTQLMDRAVAEGMLRSRLDEQSEPETAYEFAHDRVLEACRRSMSDSEHAVRSLELGRTLLGAQHAGLSLHRAARYFNTARSLVDTDQERLAGAQLNLNAGTLAKQSNAFSQALEYFQNGLEFLAALAGSGRHDVAWRDHAELTRTLFEETAAAALVNSKFELMHELCDTLLAHLASPLERVRTYEIRVGGFSAERRFPEAVAAAREILSELGLTFPNRPAIIHIVLAYIGTRRRLLGGPIERLCELPPNAVTPVVEARSRIMRAMYSSTYFGDPKLFPLLICRHIDHSLMHGNVDYSCITYVAFAMVLCARLDFENAYQLGNVTLELVESFGNDRLKAQAYMGVYGFIHPWKHHLRDALAPFSEGIASGFRHGEFEFACYLVTLQALTRLHCGDSLVELAPEFEQHRAKCVSLRQARSIVLMQIFCQIVADLRDVAGTAEPLAGPAYVESVMLPRCLEPLDHNLAFHHYMAKMLLCLMRGDPASALEAARSARRYYEEGTFGLYLGAVYTFWEALTWLVSTRTQPSEKRRALRRATRASRQLARWAESAPMNFLHKYHLVKAELCRAQRRWDQAAHHFDQAIELSQAHGYTHETAFALELAADFYLSRGMQRLGRSYLRESYATYSRWGAKAVNRRLERSYPQHFAVFATRSENGQSNGLGSLSDDLDYRVLLRSSQAISGEVRLPNLLERLLRTMFEHAGAQRGLLLLEDRGQLLVETEADVDRGNVEFVHGENADDSSRLCRAIVHYASRTGSHVVLGEATQDERFSRDPYMQKRKPKSLLCIPLQYQGRLVGLVYLENNRVSHVFTQTRVEIATLLASQAAISIATARFHALELEAQQAKINPHFLFNALSSIADLAIEDGAQTERAILQLSHLYRYILTASIEQRATLRQELEVVRSYLELERLRFGAKLEYSITCDDGAGGVEIPGLLIQPLVENAIRHGIAPKLSPGSVWIHVTRVDDHCRIVVQDDGTGPAAHATSGSGFGLRSVQERCALLYGREYSMAITRRGGYRVELKLPLQPVQPALRAKAGAPAASFDRSSP